MIHYKISNMSKDSSQSELEHQLAELKEALRVSQAALKESQAAHQKNALQFDHTSRLFESIVELSPIPMIVASTEGKLIAFNKVCLEQLGITEAKVGTPIALINFKRSLGRFF